MSLDVEVDGELPLSKGHAIASELERAIVRELGPNVEVETHLEPLMLHGLQGENVASEVVERVTSALKRRAGETQLVRDIHDVRVRKNESRLVVNYHCKVDPAISVAEMHDLVDRIDRTVRQDIPRPKFLVILAQGGLNDRYISVSYGVLALNKKVRM